jgi:hypothetical protein
VFFNGGSLAIEWFVANVDAIVEAFYPGFYGGTAVASTLFGEYNPGTLSHSLIFCSPSLSNLINNRRQIAIHSVRSRICKSS